ncbi:hypothetical protein [Paenibacillus elgii]|uniref:hypothetical protein n=1 Tax=Paenibacillus elgii TaxID=189691 RepID=UPI00203E5F0E|nr:hypothetical protein [Paenibacillus elgii]MCM3267668.1 hypothetical protein [Paenibacillus elgii]
MTRLLPYGKRAAVYVLSKLSGAGLGIAAGLAYMWVKSDFDAFEPFEALRPDAGLGAGIGMFLWLMLYGYGMLATFAIDGLARWKPAFRRSAVQALLHAAAGLLCFLVIPFRAPFPGSLVITGIAGTVGAVFALFFYAGSRLGRRSAWVRGLLGLALPLIVLGVQALYPEGVKQDWKETRGEGLYEAEFRYMNGTQNIPVYAKKGQIVSFTMTWESDKGGGYGMQVRGPGGPNDYADYRPGPPLSGDDRGFGGTIHADRDGEYVIIASGDRVKGKLKVTWAVDAKAK